jgi:hypothetical protein
VVSRPAAGGGRWVEVDPGRLERWLAGFADRHGAVTTGPLPDGLTLTGADGAEAECHLLTGAADDVAGLVEAARKPVRFGLLLVRRGGFAVGVAHGDVLTASKVDSRYVQGRTAAGGWSQQRFARRRDNQARQAWQSAAEAAERVLLPATADLAALVGGGDRRAVDAVLAEPRLAPLVARRVERFLDVPEPRLAVLEQAVTSARVVRIRLNP